MAEFDDRDDLAVEGDVNLTERRRRWWERNLSAEERRLIDRDSEYFIHQSLSTPVLTGMSRSSGAYIEDLQGNRYLDFHGNEIHNVGFNNPRVVDAVRTQLDDELAFCTRRYTNEPAVDLAEKLAEITPGDLKRSLFCPGGNDAVEMSLKLARRATGRFKTISYWDSFHGGGFGSISVGGEELFRGGLGPLLTGAMHVEYPYYYRNPWGFDSKEACDRAYLHQLEAIFEREPEIAAVIAEPIRELGLIPTERYWQGVRELCDDHDTLLIFDEICDGFGRTGAMFAAEHYVTPDALVMGKSMGGGVLPNAGVIVRDDLNVVQDRALGHYTHEKNPTTAAAGLAAIEYIEEHDLPARAAELGEYALDRLRELAEDHPLVGDVRGKGLLLAVELVTDPDTKEKAAEEAEMVMYKSLERGLSFKTTMENVLTLIPPLTITQEQLDEAIDILDRSIGEVERGEGY